MEGFRHDTRQRHHPRRGGRCAAPSPGQPWSPRTDRVARWIGGHLLELVPIVVFLALAVTVHVAWAVLAGLVGGVWAVHDEGGNLRKAAAGRRGVLTADRGPGTDTASPTPASVRGGDVPGDVEDLREPA